MLFAALLCRAQGALAASLGPLTARFADDADALVRVSEDLLRLVADRGPDAVAEAALVRLNDEPPVARARLLAYWSGESSTRDDYLSRAILRPYAETLRARRLPPDRQHNRGHCPFCGGAASVSTRRAAPDSEAGMRYLHCALCGEEWNFARISCPACAEEKPEQLPVYRSDTHPNVRVEACDTCRRYVKSIDLMADARPIAEIDDLVSMSVDLWAIDEGYTRIEPGLAGL